MPDAPGEILALILTDTWRLEAGERRLASMVTDWTKHGPVGAAVLDIDGSGAARALGIAAKANVVLQFQNLVKTLVPSEAVLVDAGSRDEVYVFIPCTNAQRMAQLCDRLRKAVNEFDFAVEDSSDPIHLTVSGGAAVFHVPNSIENVLDTVRGALIEAKGQRNCVWFSPPDEMPSRRIWLPASLVEAADGEFEAVLFRGIAALTEKHGPLWHWVGKALGSWNGRSGDVSKVAYAREHAIAPEQARAYFELVLATVALESALIERTQKGYRCVASVASSPLVNADLAACYQPAEWISICVEDEGVELNPSDVSERITVARWRSGQVPVDLKLSGYTRDVLTRISGARGRSQAQLLTEAFELGVDHNIAWYS